MENLTRDVHVEVIAVEALAVLLGIKEVYKMELSNVMIELDFF